MVWAGWDHAARAVVLVIADASVRAIVLALLAAALTFLVRRRTGAQHTVWTLVLAAMLALPFLRPILPAARVLPRSLAPLVLNPAPVRSSAIVLRISDSIPPPRPVPPTTPWLWIAAAYLTGVAFFAARLAGALVLTRRAFQDARVIHPASREYFQRITYADPNVTLEESGSVAVPLTIGLLRVRVVLPSNWRDWSQAKLDAILAHELAHARRSDTWIGLLATLNTCLFWFHPLAWWLQHRLAVLAEHAADDAALAATDPKSYALLLLESAAQLYRNGPRLAWNSVAITGPVVAQRIRRVLKLDPARSKPLGAISRVLLLTTTATLVLLTTTLDVRTLAAGQGPRRMLGPPTANNAAAWELALVTNPDDQLLRAQLIMYYMFHQQTDRALAHTLWLIDHHPDSEFARAAPPRLTSHQLDELKSHWAAQLVLHPDNARVLVNAASGGFEQQINLLERARRLDPPVATEPLARLFSQILLSNAFGAENADLAAQIRSKVESSTDIALAGAVAQYFVEGAARHALEGDPESFTDARVLATELVTHAEALGPGSGWADLMEGVKALPVR